MTNFAIYNITTDKLATLKIFMSKHAACDWVDRYGKQHGAYRVVAISL